MKRNPKRGKEGEGDAVKANIYTLFGQVLDHKSQWLGIHSLIAQIDDDVDCLRIQTSIEQLGYLIESYVGWMEWREEDIPPTALFLSLFMLMFFSIEIKEMNKKLIQEHIIRRA